MRYFSFCLKITTHYYLSRSLHSIDSSYRSSSGKGGSGSNPSRSNSHNNSRQHSPQKADRNHRNGMYGARAAKSESPTRDVSYSPHNSSSFATYPQMSRSNTTANTTVVK